MLTQRTVHLDPLLIAWLTVHGAKMGRKFSQEVNYLLETFKEITIKEEENDKHNNNRKRT